MTARGFIIEAAVGREIHPAPFFKVSQESC